MHRTVPVSWIISVPPRDNVNTWEPSHDLAPGVGCPHPVGASMRDMTGYLAFIPLSGRGVTIFEIVPLLLMAPFTPDNPSGDGFFTRSCPNAATRPDIPGVEPATVQLQQIQSRRIMIKIEIRRDPTDILHWFVYQIQVI